MLGSLQQRRREILRSGSSATVNVAAWRCYYADRPRWLAGRLVTWPGTDLLLTDGADCRVLLLSYSRGPEVACRTVNTTYRRDDTHNIEWGGWYLWMAGGGQIYVDCKQISAWVQILGRVHARFWIDLCIFVLRSFKAQRPLSEGSSSFFVCHPRKSYSIHCTDLVCAYHRCSTDTRLLGSPEKQVTQLLGNYFIAWGNQLANIRHKKKKICWTVS